MKEAMSGKVEIDDFEADTVETMVYFMYNDTVLDEKMLNTVCFHHNVLDCNKNRLPSHFCIQFQFFCVSDIYFLDPNGYYWTPPTSK